MALLWSSSSLLTELLTVVLCKAVATFHMQVCVAGFTSHLALSLHLIMFPTVCTVAPELHSLREMCKSSFFWCVVHRCSWILVERHSGIGVNRTQLSDEGSPKFFVIIAGTPYYLTRVFASILLKQNIAVGGRHFNKIIKDCLPVFFALSPHSVASTPLVEHIDPAHAMIVSSNGCWLLYLYCHMLAIDFGIFWWSCCNLWLYGR